MPGRLVPPRFPFAGVWEWECRVRVGVGVGTLLGPEGTGIRVFFGCLLSLGRLGPLSAWLVGGVLACGAGPVSIPLRVFPVVFFWVGLLGGSGGGVGWCPFVF
jgi:hypothetical protein